MYLKHSGYSSYSEHSNVMAISSTGHQPPAVVENTMASQLFLCLLIEDNMNITLKVRITTETFPLGNDVHTTDIRDGCGADEYA